MQQLKLSLLVWLCSAMTLGLAGCAHQQSRHYSSSVVDYLYPGEGKHVEKPGIPKLVLPLQVGIAFVPDAGATNYALTEYDKMALMKEVSRHFQKYDFVESIELIPSAYLRRGGGFTNLDQIRTMYGVDVMALLSYDQTQFTDQGLASITYWTIVGAYIVRGEKNDTHTMVDATVYDIQSRKLLFRAPGTSHVKNTATPVNLSEGLRADSIESFKVASEDLIQNLDTQLALFREKAKQAPEEYQIVHKEGFRGGGSFSAGLLLTLAVLAGYGVLSTGRKET